MKPGTNKKKRATAQRRAKEWDSASRRLLSQIELLQMRVAVAEDTWKEAKEQFSQAKRRRKLAKLFARRAKKHAKAAEAKLDLARKALADAKAESLTMDWPAPRKISKTKDARPRSRKRPKPGRAVRKSPLAARQAASRERSPTVPATAEGVPGFSSPAASLPPTNHGETPAIS